MCKHIKKMDFANHDIFFIVSMVNATDLQMVNSIIQGQQIGAYTPIGTIQDERITTQEMIENAEKNLEKALTNPEITKFLHVCEYTDDKPKMNDKISIIGNKMHYKICTCDPANIKLTMQKVPKKMHQKDMHQKDMHQKDMHQKDMHQKDMHHNIQRDEHKIKNTNHWGKIELHEMSSGGTKCELQEDAPCVPVKVSMSIKHKNVLEKAIRAANYIQENTIINNKINNVKDDQFLCPNAEAKRLFEALNTYIDYIMEIDIIFGNTNIPLSLPVAKDFKTYKDALIAQAEYLNLINACLDCDDETGECKFVKVDYNNRICYFINPEHFNEYFSKNGEFYKFVKANIAKNFESEKDAELFLLQFVKMFAKLVPLYLGRFYKELKEDSTVQNELMSMELEEYSGEEEDDEYDDDSNNSGEHTDDNGSVNSKNIDNDSNTGGERSDSSGKANNNGGNTNIDNDSNTGGERSDSSGKANNNGGSNKMADSSVNQRESGKIDLPYRGHLRNVLSS